MDFESFLEIFWKFRLRPEVGFERFLGRMNEFDDRLEVEFEIKTQIARIWKNLGSPLVAKVSEVIEAILNDEYFSTKLESTSRVKSSKFCACGEFEMFLRL